LQEALLSAARKTKPFAGFQVIIAAPVCPHQSLHLCLCQKSAATVRTVAIRRVPFDNNAFLLEKTLLAAY
jgi:hypothetical protein